MQLHRIGAQNLGLRKSNAGVPHRIHTSFKLLNILFQAHLRRSHIEAPCVDAASHVVKAAANVSSQVAQGGLQLLRIGIVMAVFDGEFEGHQGVIE